MKKVLFYPSGLANRCKFPVLELTGEEMNSYIETVVFIQNTFIAVNLSGDTQKFTTGLNTYVIHRPGGLCIGKICA